MKNSQIKKRICIITPGNISYTPRVVKEADALTNAGFDVRVVFSQGNNLNATSYDNELLKNKEWRCSVLKWSKKELSEFINYYKTGIRHNLLKLFPTITYKIPGIVENTEGRIYSELVNLASSAKADLYIGHYPIGLAVAAYASKFWNSKYAYDSEDLHSEEQPDNYEGNKQTKRIKIIEKKYLAGCEYISTVSEKVAERIVEIYNVPKPIVLHNVFQLLERSNLDKKRLDKRGDNLSLYWYSQVIGPDRGIEDLINAAGLIKENIQIHLRGNIDENYKKNLVNLARSYNVSNILFFHPQVSSTELFSRCVEHDIGLALEQNVSKSRMLTITNKLFFYMLAGLAVLASNTPGQKILYDKYPNMGLIYEEGNTKELANKIRFFIKNPAKLKEYKRNSFNYATNDLNWEKESHRLISKINSIFSI